MANNRHGDLMKHQPIFRTFPENYNLSDEQIKARQHLARVNVVVTQPGGNVWEFEHSWSHSLFSCSDNTSQCCYAFFCSCCFQCKLFKRAGENMWTCICPCSGFALRSKIRTAFRIEGNLSHDCLIANCCPCCSSIQLFREIHHQGL